MKRRSDATQGDIDNSNEVMGIATLSKGESLPLSDKSAPFSTPHNSNGAIPKHNTSNFLGPNLSQGIMLSHLTRIQSGDRVGMTQ